MARLVQIEVEFEVDDNVTDSTIESIFSAAFVQIDEAIDRSDDNGFVEVPIPTTVISYALSVDGAIIESFEADAPETT